MFYYAERGCVLSHSIIARSKFMKELKLHYVHATL